MNDAICHNDVGRYSVGHIILHATQNSKCHTRQVCFNASLELGPVNSERKVGIGALTVLHMLPAVMYSICSHTNLLVGVLHVATEIDCQVHPTAAAACSAFLQHS